jgi:hypothetical protein
MTQDEPVTVESFYHYGYGGREMIAIRAPFSASVDKELIGQLLRVDGGVFTVKSVLRQITGPIQKGEPIGVEIGDWRQESL